MRRLATALAALATLMLGAAAPLVAHAADKADSKAITKEQRDKGMKDAPAIAQKAGVPCTVTDAYYLGAANDKTGKSDIYEVACQQGLGYVLMAKAGETKAYDCLAAETQPSLSCKLPGNADPSAGLTPIVAAAGVTCTPTKARYVGANATTTVYEVACQQGPGYIVQTAAVGAAAAPAKAIPCIETSGTSMACTLTSKAQSDAMLAALVAKSGKTCAISNDRYVGTDQKNGDSYFEVACGAQPGFVIASTKAGGLDRIISCGQAQGLGGCTMTDATVVSTDEIATYTKLAKAGGYNCDVSKYRPIGLDANKSEVVELACSNRPDGTVAVFPDSPTAKAQFVDCVQAGKFGPNGACTLTSKAPILAKYSAALAAKGRSSCKVSNARYLGVTASNNFFVETACTDGNPGWVIEFSQADQVQSLLNCAQAKSAGMACQLPTNTKG